MRIEIVVKHLGQILLFNAAFLFISFLISAINFETSAMPLGFTALMAALLGVLPMVFVKDNHELGFNEGIFVVVMGWILTCLVGAVPYVIWGGEFTFVNAWFESVSGFTTTGSTVLQNVEALPSGLLFWRSTTHWIGGVGIILFVLLILPEAKNSKFVLFNAEVSDLSKSNFKFRSKKILQVLAFVYVLLTALETGLLCWAGMSFFDAINHSFSTIATGGFSTKNMSVAFYNSITIEVIITTFMVLSGIHFGLLFATITFRKKNIFTSPVVQAYFGMMVVGTFIIAIKLYFSDMYPFWTAVRYASFQVASVGTTTGFATVDTANWPSFTQIILIYFTIQCAMIGSTSGGMKFDRIYIFFQSFKKQLRLLKHPRAVIPLKIGSLTVKEGVELHTMVFIVLYTLVFLLVALILTAIDVDMFTAFSASITTIGNVGPGFAGVSSLGNFSGIPTFGKYLLSVNMLLGRLEIFNILAFFLIRRSS
jgi:trk system potassium uptake protein TrkH